jgi:hypothetical protein
MPPKPEPEEPEAPRTFWTTLPGLFTGMAAMLTALGALVAALGAAGLFSLPRGAGTSEASTPLPESDGIPQDLIPTGGDADPAIGGTAGEAAAPTDD